MKWKETSWKCHFRDGIHKLDGVIVITYSSRTLAPFQRHSVHSWHKRYINSSVQTLFSWLTSRISLCQSLSCFSIKLSRLVVTSWRQELLFVCLPSRPQELRWICPKSVNTGAQREFKACWAPRPSAETSDPPQDEHISYQRLPKTRLSVRGFLKAHHFAHYNLPSCRSPVSRWGSLGGRWAWFSPPVQVQAESSQLKEPLAQWLTEIISVQQLATAKDNSQKEQLWVTLLICII